MTALISLMGAKPMVWHHSLNSSCLPAQLHLPRDGPVTKCMAACGSMTEPPAIPWDNCRIIPDPAARKRSQYNRKGFLIFLSSGGRGKPSATSRLAAPYALDGLGRVVYYGGRPVPSCHTLASGKASPLSHNCSTETRQSFFATFGGGDLGPCLEDTAAAVTVT